MKSTSRPAAGLISALLFGLLMPQPVAAAPDYLRFYKTGLSSVDSGAWDQVESMMRRAIQERSEEKQGWVLLRKGYFPHFYLGSARYHLGDCRGALESWAESEKQGAIVGRDEYADLRRMRDDCQKNGRPSLGGKSSASSADADGGGTTGKEKVRTGQHWVEKGADPTQKALSALESVAPNSDLGQAAHQGQKVVEVAKTATELVDLALPPAQALEAAINAYFAGEPQRTLQILTDIDLSDPRARAQVYLFRAAASFRIHVLAGGDSAELAKARKSAELFRQQQWRGDFPAELFDPRFVLFLRGGD